MEVYKTVILWYNLNIKVKKEIYDGQLKLNALQNRRVNWEVRSQKGVLTSQFSPAAYVLKRKHISNEESQAAFEEWKRSQEHT